MKDLQCIDELQRAWQSTWTALGQLRPPDTLFDQLLTRYQEPDRAYHTVQHLRECLAHSSRIQCLAQRPAEVLLALWFHDAVYDTRRHDNEQCSAQWAGSVLQEAASAPEVIERVSRLIMATAHRAEPATLDEQVLVDVDLSILGAPAERFDEYERQVRAEYAWVPEDIFRSERARLLQGLLKRASLYSTSHFQDLLEQSARANLTRSMAAL